jgi:type II restriction/modification system DNA methylase subunit YeeA
MTPEQFIAKWQSTDLKERAAAQSHFNDLCELLDEPKPTDADPKGEWYCFERGATKTTGGRGWADVWKCGHFGWEYKSRGESLDRALDQLKRYAFALDNPPLLIACNLDAFLIVTNWTNAVSTRHEFSLASLRDPANRQKLKWAFEDPERLRPGLTRRHVTETAARKFAELAKDLRAKGHEPQAVAHFVNRLVFCMFAEDIGLLPGTMFTRMLKEAARNPSEFGPLCRSLFGAMQKGGRLGLEHVDWFNGGLFDDDSVLPLTQPEFERILDAANMDWSEIDPSIMGTLFERGLDPDKRSQIGAHYTDPEKIMKIIEPVIKRPLEAEWATARAKIEIALANMEEARSRRPETMSEARRVHRVARQAEERAHREAQTLASGFLERVRQFRVLDPACGSGNFLYLALHTLKDLEQRVLIELEAMGLGRGVPLVGPEQLLGIEINPYAAELARVSVWIGEIQWMKRHGFNVSTNPILRPLDTISCRDAILRPDGTEPEWPPADVIIGNPPYLGAKLMKRRLGLDYTERLRQTYTGRLKGFSDLVCYWFEKARLMLLTDRANRVGLVATNSIRKGTNRPVLEQILDEFVIFEAWTGEQWTIEGAAVDVSIVCFGRRNEIAVRSILDGQVVRNINPDLTTGLNLTKARPLSENWNHSFLGIQKSGPFDIPGRIAREWLRLPVNPHGISNASILKPYWNGDDVTSRNRDVWLIDLPVGLSEKDIAFFEAPFGYLSKAAYDPDNEQDKRTHREARREARDKHARQRWWEPYWPRPEMRERIQAVKRYIVTTETSEHRLFVWMWYPVLPDKNLIVIPLNDDATFGILQSRFHELWALRQGSDLEDRPRYTSTTTFATFPFPERLTPDDRAGRHADDYRAVRIAAVAKRLNELRENWLNPFDLVVRVPEVVSGFPDRILPRDEQCAKEQEADAHEALQRAAGLARQCAQGVGCRRGGRLRLACGSFGRGDPGAAVRAEPGPGGSIPGGRSLTSAARSRGNSQKCLYRAPGPHTSVACGAWSDSLNSTQGSIAAVAGDI